MKPSGNRPTVQLSGTDGNAFVVIGTVTNALRRAKLRKEADEFKTKCLAAKSYDEVLCLAMEYADIQ